MTEAWVNEIGMAFVTIPAGTFVMGGDPVGEQADENETPRHPVTFEKPFLMGCCPVTQTQWVAVMGENPSHFPGDENPVETVSHDDASRFIDALNRLEKCRLYRLPTEAEWEYAARAGSQSTYCFGDRKAQLAEYAWFRNNSDGRTHPAGRLTPNAWGLYDMHGNVHEWCADWFDRTYYARSPDRHPTGPEAGVARALRGGDWGSEDWYCRSAIRSLSSPQRRSNRVGFRMVRLTEPEPQPGKGFTRIRKIFSKR